jgi:hypothetical protein
MVNWLSGAALQSAILLLDLGRCLRLLRYLLRCLLRLLARRTVKRPGTVSAQTNAGRRHECALCMLHRYAALAPVSCPALTACEPACAPSRGVSGHARTRSASPHTPYIHIHLMAASWGCHGLPTRSRSRNGFTRPPPGSYCSTWRRAHGGRTSGIGRPQVWPTHPDHLWPLLSPCGSTRPLRAS